MHNIEPEVMAVAGQAKGSGSIARLDPVLSFKGNSVLLQPGPNSTTHLIFAGWRVTITRSLSRGRTCSASGTLDCR